MQNREPFELYDCLKNEVSRCLKNVILISSSKARCSELIKLGANVVVSPENIEEDNPKFGNPYRLTLANASNKMNSFVEHHDMSRVCYPLLSADTLISLSDGESLNKRNTGRIVDAFPIIGKPNSKKEAYDMLCLLRNNRIHTVTTSQVLSFFDSGEYVTISETDSSIVEFRDDISDTEIAEYVETLEWEGAAGAYRIQDKGKELIKSVYGDLGTVIGLGYRSLYSLLLKKSGVVYS